MRILHLDTGVELRGGQRQMLLLQAGLARRDYDQTVLARGEALRRSGGERATPWALVRAVRKADLIHAHDARAHSWAAFLCPGKPLVVSRRVAFPPRSDALSRWKYSRPRRFLAVSNYVGFKLKAAGVPADRIDLRSILYQVNHFDRFFFSFINSEHISEFYEIGRAHV